MLLSRLYGPLQRYRSIVAGVDAADTTDLLLICDLERPVQGTTYSFAESDSCSFDAVDECIA